jgi:hypothetical protein
MYAYRVGHSAYESNHEVVLIHEKLFSYDEFEEMVIDAYYETAQAAVARKKAESSPS